MGALGAVTAEDAVAAAACAGGNKLACVTLALKHAHTTGELTLLPGRKGWRPCVSCDELGPGEVLEEGSEGVWCWPREGGERSAQSCADLMAWKAAEWKRLGRDPFEWLGGGGRYKNPYGVVACRESIRPVLGHRGELRIYGPMPWGTRCQPLPGAVTTMSPRTQQQAVFTVPTRPAAPTAPEIPPGAVAVFDPDIGQFRILAPS